jgi:hypothetical protein
MLPARQLTDASDGAVDSFQPRTIALTPDHAFVVGRRNLATALDQGAVSIEQQLRIVERAAVALVDADGRHYACLPAGIADRQDYGRRHRHSLFKQPEMFRDHLERPLHKREIGIIRHHRLREGGELHALATKLDDFPDNLVHSAFTAVEHWADLHGGGFDDDHGAYPFPGRLSKPVFGYS